MLDRELVRAHHLIGRADLGVYVDELRRVIDLLRRRQPACLALQVAAQISRGRLHVAQRVQRLGRSARIAQPLTDPYRLAGAAQRVQQLVLPALLGP